MKIEITFDKSEIREGTPGKSGFYAVLFDGDCECWRLVQYSRRYNMWNTFDYDDFEGAKKTSIDSTSKKYIYISSGYTSMTDDVSHAITHAAFNKTEEKG